MTNRPRVAVFPCGTEVGLEVNRALRYEKIVEVVGVSSVPCHGQYVYDNYHSDAPWCDDAALIEYLNALKVDFIYPTNEQALEYLTMMSGMLYGKIVGHPISTVELCGDKALTYEYLQDKVRVPACYNDEHSPKEKVFVKPRKGHSGIGARIVEPTVHGFMVNINEEIVCEYLPGEEYTVDCFTQDKELLYFQGRTRENVTKGISGVSRLYESEEIERMAHVLNFAIPFTGAWFFQVKRATGGELCLLEIGARIAGSSSLSRARGINLPLLHLYEAMNTKVIIPTAFPVTEISRSLDVKAKLPEEIMTAYFDYDDCLIQNGYLNPLMMAFAWSLVKKGIKVAVLTRNIYKKNDTEPFTATINIPDNQRKSFWSDDYSMLIDDSFEERKGWKYAIAPDQVEMFL